MTFRLAPMLESHVTKDDPEAEWSYTGTKRDGNIVTGTCIGFFEVEAICTIHGMNGEILSRCSARCNNREAKYRGLAIFDIRNTIQKMAEKRAFVSAVLMATGASDIFTQDIEDFPELIEGHVNPAIDIMVSESASPSAPASSSSNTKPNALVGSNAGQGLSPKRSAWLLRVGVEAKVAPEAMDRCMAYLRNAGAAEVKSFFDDLSKRRDVFQPFLT